MLFFIALASVFSSLLFPKCGTLIILSLEVLLFDKVNNNSRHLRSFINAISQKYALFRINFPSNVKVYLFKSCQQAMLEIKDFIIQIAMPEESENIIKDNASIMSRH